MKTVLFATGGTTKLWPLAEFTTGSLLPVADKPLLIHAVESLAMAGLANIIVVVAAFGDDVKKTLGDGAQWGMRFEYLTQRHGEPLRDVQYRLAAELSQDFLLVHGEILRTPIIHDFLARATSLKDAVVAATIRGVAAGVTVVRRGSPTSSPVPGYSGRMGKGVAVIDFPEACLSLVESPAALHRANLAVIAGRFPGLMLAGRQLLPQVRVGRKSRLPTKAIKGTPLFVGARCRIAASAELMSETVVSSDSVIDRCATLHRAVVMPHTYVGALVEVSDAIVSGNLVIHIDSGTHAWVTDQFLLSSISKRPFATLVEGAVARLRSMLRAAPPRSPTQPSRLPDRVRDGTSPAEVRWAWNHRADPEQEAAVESERIVDRAARA
jgi:mannose-1-phosphate guanylyltransferase/phosphomannomutase